MTIDPDAPATLRQVAEMLRDALYWAALDAAIENAPMTESMRMAWMTSSVSHMDWRAMARALAAELRGRK